ncbi:MAG: hypothetical protein H8E48_07250 [Chloroflexi bacterium]|nr:hypothetical protein [Chloroflexota bacterium]
MDPDTDKWTGLNFYTNKDDCVMKYTVDFDLSTAVSDYLPTPVPNLPSGGRPSEITLELEPGLTVHLEGTLEGERGAIRATVNGPEGIEVRLGFIGTGGLGNMGGTIDATVTVELFAEVKAGRYQIGGTVGIHEIDVKLTFP